MEDKLDLILERESVLASMQCTTTELKREIEQYKEENRFYYFFLFFKFKNLIW